MISRQRSLDYYSHVRQIVIAILLFTLAVPALHAQIHGVPPSVTSLGPGRGPTPGVPASVTSLGPNGYDGGNPAIVLPNCCRFTTGPNRGQFRHRHHNHGNAVVYYPYAVPVYASPYYGDSAAADDSAEEEDNGGPTVFDRRGPGTGASASRYSGADADTSRLRQDLSGDGGRNSSVTASAEGIGAAGAMAPAPSSDQIPTVLVFKDGHKLDVQNYAIVGDMLYDLTPGHPRKVALSDLDLAATQKANEDQGTTFQLPAQNSGS